MQLLLTIGDLDSICSKEGYTPSWDQSTMQAYHARSGCQELASGQPRIMCMTSILLTAIMTCITHGVHSTLTTAPMPCTTPMSCCCVAVSINGALGLNWSWSATCVGTCHPTCSRGPLPAEVRHARQLQSLHALNNFKAAPVVAYSGHVGSVCITEYLPGRTYLLGKLAKDSMMSSFT